MFFSINTTKAQGGDCEDCPQGGGGIPAVPDRPYLTPIPPITPGGITPFTTPPIVPPIIDPPPVGGGNNPDPDYSGGDSGFGGYRPPDPQPDLNPGGGGSYDPSGTGNGPGGGGYDPSGGGGYQDECTYNPCYCYGDCGGSSGSNSTSSNNSNEDDTEEEKTWYLDKDGDGYYSDKKQAVNSPGSDWSTSGSTEDCDDNSFNPFNTCEEENTITYYIDEDGDGFHGSTIEIIIGMRSPGPPYKSTTRGKDCDDSKFDLANFCIPESDCEKRVGLLHDANFKDKTVTLGNNTTLSEDNFRNEDGTFTDVNCGTGKIEAGSSVRILDITPLQVKRQTGVDSNGNPIFASTTSSYYKIEYEDCPKGNNKDNGGDYDPNKPCSDCNKGNPLKKPEIAAQLGGSKIKGGMYGMTRNKGTKWHRGVDLKSEYGDPIYAMFDGTATLGNQSNGAGDYVIITSKVNGKTVQTMYFHMQDDNRVSGEVKAGDIIGYQGDSGNLKKAIEDGYAVSHLHVKVKENGTVVDPEKYMKTSFDDTTGKATHSSDCD